MSAKKNLKTKKPATPAKAVKAEKTARPAKVAKPEKAPAKSGRKVRVYTALVQGAQDGLTGDALFAHVQTQRADVDSKRIAKAGLQALGDRKLTEKPVLDAIYELVIAHRLAGKTVAAKKDPDTPAKTAGNDDTPRKKARKKAA